MPRFQEQMAGRNERGYSLVEVLIASVLMGIAIVAVFQTVSHGSRMSRKDFLTRRAYQKLELILENPEHSYKGNYYVKAARDGAGGLVEGTHPLPDVVLDDRDTPGDPSDDLMATTELEVEDLTLNATIGIDNPAACCGSVNAKKLTARIIWYEQGERDTVKLETIVSLVNIN